MEQEITKVVFTFADGTEKVLEGEELGIWEVICSGMSDYLLPGEHDHVLASAAHGMIRGFVPASAVG